MVKRMPIRFNKPNKKKRDIKSKAMTMLLFVSLLTLSYSVTILYQASRYDFDVFDCTEMTDECYTFFKGLGFNVTKRRGAMDGSDPDEYWPEPYEKYRKAHIWIVFNTMFGELEFETTTLMFGNISNDWEIIREQ